MAGPFAQDFIESVRAASDIVQLISDYVPLKRAGTRFKGLCPFHEEKTPSFSVEPNRQLFYCFGCQAGGDLFKFVQLYEQVPFPEAVEALANRAGLPLPEKTRQPGQDRRERLISLNRAAADFFKAALGAERTGAAARDYLERRRLSETIVEQLGIGYAPDDWEALRKRLLSKGFKSDELLTAGLTLQRKSGQGEYDRFRDRLIFPIRDVSGSPVAFGGRAIGDAEPKYINSPETPVYTKGDHLYGLDIARESIRRKGLAVVVEGYLDLAAVRQAGFEHVVASLGTAFTPAQARLLARYTNRVVFSYDGDAAGSAATARTLDLFVSRGFDVRVVKLPGKTDPDDFIRDRGAEAYGELIEGAQDMLEFLLGCETAGRDLSRRDERVHVVSAMLPHLARMRGVVERADAAERVADVLGIDDALILQELRSAARSGAETMRTSDPGPNRPIREVEARLVDRLLASAPERERWAGEIDLEDLAETQVRGIVEKILEMTRQGEAVGAPELLEALTDEDDRARVTRISFIDFPESGPSVEDCLSALHRQRLARQERELRRRIAQPATADDVDSQLSRLQELARQRDALS